MTRTDRTSDTANQIIDWVISGELAADAPLPPESDLADRCGVSRLTLRESIRLLQAQGVIEKVPGTRHRVVPVERWTGLRAIMRLDRHDPAGARSSVDLLEVRMMIETGAATRAAERRTDAHLSAMRADIDQMVAGHAAGDVASFVEADLRFHDTIMDAADNRVLVATMRTLTDLLSSTRTETSSSAEIREHAISWHKAILERIEAKDSAGATDAMAGHMQQTYDDLMHYVLGRQSNPGASAPAAGRSVDTDTAH